MSTIRKQSLISSVIVYAGFALGFLNIYLFTREGSGFTKAQYGLTSTFIYIASVLFSLASLGVPAYIGKLFPYYKAHLEPKRNDQFTWALLFPLGGFVLVTALGFLFKKPVIDRIFSNSPEFVQYYYWLFPFALGYTLFMVLEGFAWLYKRSVLSNLFKELLFRFLVTILIVLLTTGMLGGFDNFIRLYAFTYPVLALLLLTFFIRNKQLHFVPERSKVTRRLMPQILALAAFNWGSGIIFNLAGAFDSIVIMAVLPQGVALAGIYNLGQTFSSLIQAPQRAVVSASLGTLSEAWREKNLGRIQRIYHQSSINQLIFASALFCLLWLNFRDGLQTFHIQRDFDAAAPVLFFMGLRMIVDMGTGVSSQIILTSSWWRFEFQSGLVLLVLSLGLSYVLTRHLGIVGPAIANLISYTVYNAVRFLFLWRKFRMQPFTWASLYSLLLAAAAYAVAYFPCEGHSGFGWIILRCTLFGAVFVPGVIALKLSPDIAPVWATVKKRLGGK